MAIDTMVPRSRRAMLAAIGGALAALGAQALGRPLPALAEGEVVHVGGDYFSATSATQIRNQTDDSDVIIATSNGSGRGVYGTTSTGIGVQGRARSSGTGVYGLGATGPGVVGRTSAVSTWAGVGGYATQAGAPGVWGGNEATGVSAALAVSDYGLDVNGRARFRKISGVATIPDGNRAVDVHVDVDLDADSFVLLTPRNNLGGRDLWYSLNTADNTFRISLSSSRPSTTRIAWLLLG